MREERPAEAGGEQGDTTDARRRRRGPWRAVRRGVSWVLERLGFLGV